jgi:hypothetical protein
MALPPFKIINIDDLKEYKKYDKYDDYLRETNKSYYDNLGEPRLEEKNGISIEEQMEDAIRFFASKGVGELTQILQNFNIEDDIKNGVKEYFGSAYSSMNENIRNTIAKNKLAKNELTKNDLDLDFNDIIKIYDKLKNPNPRNSANWYDTYIYNTLNAFTKTTPCTDKFCVFRCYQKLYNGAPVLTPEGNFLPYIYLNNFTSTSILLRLCDYWCTPAPINKDTNTTNLHNPNMGDNTIICIEIPESTRGISLINYAGIISGSFTTDYSEFEYLLPPGGFLSLTNRTYNYTSITRTNLRIKLGMDPLDPDDPFPHLPIQLEIPIYTYMSNVANNPSYKTISYTKYSYIMPKVKNIFTRAITYIKDGINIIKTKTMKKDGYMPLEGGKRKQNKKRKSKKQTRKQTKKHTKKFTKKQTKKQNRKKNKKINYKNV